MNLITSFVRSTRLTLCLFSMTAILFLAPQRAAAQTFGDVSDEYWAYIFVESLAQSAITSGCGGGNFCPENPVTRAQMAIFLERGINGSGFAPPPATGTVFDDVGINSFAAAFIERLAADGITGGCGGGNYCPNNNVTRAQMAVFLLRAIYGSAYSPPPATGVFADVPIDSFADDWIEQLAAEGITSGCGNGNFCPHDQVTRAQMSVFLVRAFGLPIFEPPLEVTDYQGWFWGPEILKTSPTSLEESSCWGQNDLALVEDGTWTLTGMDELCWGRTTTNSGRIIDNFDTGTGTFISFDDFTDRSTRPLVGAGGNLHEAYGEEVVMNVGQGEERLAVLMPTPSDDSLIILSGVDSSAGGGVEEYSYFLDVFVKSTDEIQAALEAADLSNTNWRVATATRSLDTEGVVGSVEFAVVTVQNVDLLAGGVCQFLASSVFPDSTSSADFYIVTHFDDNDNLEDRGVQIAADKNNATDCSYEIDEDQYLAVTYTRSNADPENLDPEIFNWRFVVSDDRRYLVPAPAASGPNDNPQLFQVGYRAASGAAPALVDGTYFFNYVQSEYEASGVFSSYFNIDLQEIEVMGRGKMLFDSMTPGTVPPGEAGIWFNCVMEFVADVYETQYTGNFTELSVASITSSISGSLPYSTCDYQLEMDGSLAIYVTLGEGEELLDVKFRGYANDNGELVSLVYAGDDDPDLVEDPETEDFGVVMFLLGMKYSGNPDDDQDDDGLTNLQEFQFPLPDP